MKPANNAWVTTVLSRWSQGSHPKGKWEAGFIPDAAPDMVNLYDGCGLRATAAAYRLRLEVDNTLPNVMRGSATCGKSRVR